MQLYGHGTTHTGLVRDANEDAFLIAPAGDALLLALVADGLGGHQAGEVASAHAVDEFRRCAEGGDFAPAATDETRRGVLLTDAAYQAHEVIANDGARDYARSGMATTLTAVLATPANGTLVQVGDSRCYRWHAGALEALSTDQTLARELFDAGKINAVAYATHPKRHMLSQCLGLDAWNMPLSPVLTEFEWSSGDRLLLCSDGLTDMVDDAGIAAILADGASLEDTASTLRDAALAAGGRDNVTVVLVDRRDRSDGSLGR